MNFELVKEISVSELMEGVQKLSKNCCPGEDGFSTLFFQTYWDVVWDKLCRVCNTILQSGVMPMSMALGLIYVIPKGNIQSVELGMWRPITLLNTVYKIYANVLSLRIQKILLELIHSSHTGFVKESSILDNLLGSNGNCDEV